MKRALAFTLMVLAIMVIAVSCEEPQAPHEHEFSKDWTSDAEYHWHEATCHTDEVDGKEAHKFGNLIPDTAATESTTGKGHRVCSVCGYEREEEISVLGHSHKLSSGYVSDDPTGHWQKCSGCNSKVNFSAHDMKWVSADDLNHEYKCSVCGYVDKEKTEAHEMAVTEYETTGKKERWCTKCSYKKTLADSVTEEAKVTPTTVTVNGENKTVNAGFVNIEANVSANETASSSSQSGNTTTVTFPEGALKMNEGAESVSLTVKAVAVSEVSTDTYFAVEKVTVPSDSSASDTTEEVKATVVAGFEFTLNGASSTDLSGTTTTTEGKKEGTTVKTYIAPGLGDKGDLQIVYVGNSVKETNSNKPEIVTYRNNDGYLEFVVYHFSRYAIVSTTKIAVDENNVMYDTLENAISGAKGTTIKLLRDLECDTTIEINQKATIDLNGKTITFDGSKLTTAIANKSNLTLKNGKIIYQNAKNMVDETTKTARSYSVISNSGTLDTYKLDVTVNVAAECVVGISSFNSAYNDDNSCPGVYVVSQNGNATFDSTNITLTVDLATDTTGLIDTTSDPDTFTGVKPIIICQGGSGKTVISNKSVFTASTTVPGGVIGLYVMSETAAPSAEISDSTITVTNSSLGWTRPVFADGRKMNPVNGNTITITINNSNISSKDTFTKTYISKMSSALGGYSSNITTSTNRVYGFKAQRNSVVYIDNYTYENLIVSKIENDSDATIHRYATEIKNGGETVAGQIINTDTNTWYVDSAEGLNTALDAGADKIIDSKTNAWYVSSESDLKNALATEETNVKIILAKDIELTSQIYMKKNVELDMAGNDITATKVISNSVFYSDKGITFELSNSSGTESVLDATASEYDGNTYSTSTCNAIGLIGNNIGLSVAQNITIKSGGTSIWVRDNDKTGRSSVTLSCKIECGTGDYWYAVEAYDYVDVTLSGDAKNIDDAKLKKLWGATITRSGE